MARETRLPRDTLTQRPLSTTTVSRAQGTHHYTSSTVQPQYLLMEKWEKEPIIDPYETWTITAELFIHKPRHTTEGKTV